MRAFIPVIVGVALSAGVVYHLAPEVYSCVQPIHYSVGELDERFDISEREFVAEVEAAEELWENEAGKELFVYDEDARFAINLIYDERQEKTELVEESEKALDSKWSQYQDAENQYRELEAEYKLATSSFKERVSRYEALASEHADKVAEWNDSSRESQGRYMRLAEEDQELRQMYSSLKNEEQRLASLYEEVSQALDYRNGLVEDYNLDVRVFNKRFGGQQSFDQGEYSRGEINIYQFENLVDLRLVLAHELGHALGLDHVEDPTAIMYYLMQNQPTDPVQLMPADKTALSVRCPLN